jgi:hypothetical protein
MPSPDSMLGSRDGRHGGARTGLAIVADLGSFFCHWPAKEFATPPQGFCLYFSTAIELGVFPTLYV